MRLNIEEGILTFYLSKIKIRINTMNDQCSNFNIFLSIVKRSLENELNM